MTERVEVYTRRQVLQRLSVLRNDLAQWERLERRYVSRQHLEEELDRYLWLLGDDS
jgi:hypothetical protein